MRTTGPATWKGRFADVIRQTAGRGVLRFCNALLLCVTVVPTAWAQPAVQDAESAMRAATTVERWVRSWAVEGEAPVVEGAAVILRRDGRVVAQAEAFGEASGNLERASRLAMVRALGQSVGPRGLEGTPGEDVTIEVELAGTLIPVDGNSDLALVLGVSPGLDGVAVRLGERVEARFPSQMRHAGTDAAAAIRALVSELADDPTRGLDEIAKLREAGYAFYRFRTVDLVQSSPGTGFVFAHRGGRVVDRSEIDSGRLRQMADGMVGHLSGRLWPGVEPYGLMGTLDPVSGRVEARAESPAGQALAAAALLRYAATAGADAEMRERAGATAREILEELAMVAGGETEPWSNPADAAATIIALTAHDAAMEGELGTLFERCVARVTPAYDPRGRLFTEEVPESAWGLVALALVRLSADGSVSPEIAEGAVRAAFRYTPPERLVGQLPWLGWAELERLEADAAVPSAPTLLETRRLIFGHQLDSATLGSADRDLAGGVVFTTGSTPLPTWQTIRPLPFLADMLADDRLTSGTLTEGEAAAELGRLLSSVRFLHQLCAGPVEGTAYHRPARAAWGVRMALWDQRMSIEATALGLETVCRTLDAVDALAARSALKNKGEEASDGVSPMP